MILFDECVHISVRDAVMAAGWMARWMGDVGPTTPDDGVLIESVRHGEILVTQDKDFGALVAAERRTAIGVVLVRPAGIPLADLPGRVVKALDAHRDQLVGQLLVVSSAGVRTRLIGAPTPRVTPS